MSAVASGDRERLELARKTVPDELIMAMVRESIASVDGKPIRLDGFPRTVAHAARVEVAARAECWIRAQERSAGLSGVRSRGRLWNAISGRGVAIGRPPKPGRCSLPAGTPAGTPSRCRGAAHVMKLGPSPATRDARTPAAAGVLGIELGGLQPPPSWGRSKLRGA